MNTLNDYCEFIVDCEHKTAPIQDIGYPSIRTPNIGPGFFILDGVNRVSEATYTEWTKRAIPLPGDLILAREAPVGNVAVIPEGQQFCLGQRTVLLRPNKAKALPDYLCYLLLTPIMRGQLLCKSGGATVHHLNMKDIRALSIGALPSLTKQSQIASVIKVYDDLIEANSRRIVLLEESARLLYREWFVKLRFPGYESVKWKDGLPEGWSRQSLYDVADLTMGYPFQSSHFNSVGLGKAAIRIRDIPDVKASTWTTEDPGSEEYEVLRGDFLIGMDGFFHMNHWASDPAWLVQRVCRVRPKNSIYRGLLALSLHDPIKHFEATISGATVAHLGAKHLKTIEIVMPSLRHADLLEQLNNLIDQKIALIAANVVATQARDELLPRLMSGTIQV